VRDVRGRVGITSQRFLGGTGTTVSAVRGRQKKVIKKDAWYGGLTAEKEGGGDVKMPQGRQIPSEMTNAVWSSFGKSVNGHETLGALKNSRSKWGKKNKRQTQVEA